MNLEFHFCYPFKVGNFPCIYSLTCQKQYNLMNCLSASCCFFLVRFSSVIVIDVRNCFQMAKLSKLFFELKLILYGNVENEPVAEACAELTQEFFKENTLRLLIIFLPKLNLEVRMLNNNILYFNHVT